MVGKACHLALPILERAAKAVGGDARARSISSFVDETRREGRTPPMRPSSQPAESARLRAASLPEFERSSFTPSLLGSGAGLPGAEDRRQAGGSRVEGSTEESNDPERETDGDDRDQESHQGPVNRPKTYGSLEPDAYK